MAAEGKYGKKKVKKTQSVTSKLSKMSDDKRARYEEFKRNKLKEDIHKFFIIPFFVL